MRILFDHGTPAPLRRALVGHHVSTAHEMGWDRLDNSALLNAAEGEFDAVITTDNNMRYQQSVRGRRVAIVVLPTTRWPVIKLHEEKVASAVSMMRTGEYVELEF